MFKITLLDKEFKMFIPAEKIQTEVENIADRMNSELKNEDVIFIGVMNGAFMFASDLLRKISFNTQVSFVKLTSYQGIIGTGKVRRLMKVLSIRSKREFYNKDIKLDYIGFKIPKDFVVGYGLDYQGYGRNLRSLYKLEE